MLLELVSVLLGLALIFLTTLILNWYSVLSKYDCLRNVPGPKPWPIIGNANEVGKTTVDLLQSFNRLHQQYGTFFKLWLGPRLHLMISKPELLESLLTSNVHLTKSDGYDLFKPWLGDGLLVSVGRKWKSRRKMITLTFHFKILEKFMVIFNKHFDLLIDILAEEVAKNGDKSIEITSYINLASLDAICETSFGTPLNAQINGNREYVKSVTEILEIITLRFFSVWLRNPLLFRFSSLYPKYKHNLKVLHDFTNAVIVERKEASKIRKKGAQISDDGIKMKAALLDMLLKATCDGEELSDEDIREEVDTFMFEGHDTSATAMCYVLYAISQNPDVQSKVYQELVDIVGPDSKTELTLSQINNLKYLDIVVKEAMRIYTPVPIIERRLEEDWTIDGLTIPRDTNISIFIYGMNRLPEVFPDPEKFDPERFLPENQAKRNAYSFIPFSAGPRNCIGQKYALYELKACVIKFLLKFDIMEDASFQPEIGMSSVLKSRNGIKIKMRPRRMVE